MACFSESPEKAILLPDLDLPAAGMDWSKKGCFKVASMHKVY